MVDEKNTQSFITPSSLGNPICCCLLSPWCDATRVIATWCSLEHRVNSISMCFPCSFSPLLCCIVCRGSFIFLGIIRVILVCWKGRFLLKKCTCTAVCRCGNYNVLFLTFMKPKQNKFIHPETEILPHIQMMFN